MNIKNWLASWANTNHFSSFNSIQNIKSLKKWFLYVKWKFGLIRTISPIENKLNKIQFVLCSDRFSIFKSGMEESIEYQLISNNGKPMVFFFFVTYWNIWDLKISFLVFHLILVSFGFVGLEANLKYTIS